MLSLLRYDDSRTWAADIMHSSSYVVSCSLATGSQVSQRFAQTIASRSKAAQYFAGG